MSSYYVTTDPDTGIVLTYSTTPEPTVSTGPRAFEMLPTSYYQDTQGDFKLLPRRGRPGEVWDRAAEQWVAGQSAEDIAAAERDWRDRVNAERDRRLLLGFDFQGKRFDYRARDKANISGAASSAGLAVLSGALPLDLRWSDPTTDFVWIAQDDSIVPMDAPTCLAFGRTAMAHEAKHVFAARALKQAGNQGQDISADAHWP